MDWREKAGRYVCLSITCLERWTQKAKWAQWLNWPPETAVVARLIKGYPLTTQTRTNTSSYLECQACGDVQHMVRALVKPKNQPGWVLVAPWWLKWSKIYTVDVWTAKTSSNTASPDTCQSLKPPFELFTSLWTHPCYNQPQLGRPKFRLELIVQWCGYVCMLVVLVWFCLMCNLERPRLGHN